MMLTFDLNSSTWHLQLTDSSINPLLQLSIDLDEPQLNVNPI